MADINSYIKNLGGKIGQTFSNIGQGSSYLRRAIIERQPKTGQIDPRLGYERPSYTFGQGIGSLANPKVVEPMTRPTPLAYSGGKKIAQTATNEDMNRANAVYNKPMVSSDSSATYPKQAPSYESMPEYKSFLDNYGNATNNQNNQPEVKSNVAYDDTKSRYIDAFNKYIETLNPSKATTEAMKKYGDFATSIDEGLGEIAGKPMASRFVTGEKAGLLRQNQATADRLQRDITLAQESDKARQTAGLAGVSLQEKLLGLENKTLPDIAKEYEYAKSQGYTGSFNDYRTQNTSNLPALAKEYEYAKSQGYGGTFDQYRQNKGATQGSETSSTILKLVNSILPNASRITGLGQNPLNFLGITNAKTLNEYNQLKGLLSLENRQLLKGSGAISDYESRVLDKAASSLGRNLTNEEFISVLNEMKKDLEGKTATGSSDVFATSWF